MPEIPQRKQLVWLSGEIRTPPFSKTGRIEAGKLLRRLQRGEMLSFPHSRPMPVVGRFCHELRVLDEAGSWRVVYRPEPSAVVIVEVFRKTTVATPPRVIANCQRRLRLYLEAERSD